ncbi:hypothetical protein Tco_1553466 [Tanacetum coccineum]
MRISVTRRRNDTMQMSVPPILCFKDYPKISTNAQITTIEAKAIWDNVKMFLAVLSSQKKTENLSCTMSLRGSRCFQVKTSMSTMFAFHNCHDIRNIRMTMPNIQVNSKFVNNMSPEWDRFVTAVKLNKGLKETNHEQMYAYLKQQWKHAAQDR